MPKVEKKFVVFRVFDGQVSYLSETKPYHRWGDKVEDAQRFTQRQAMSKVRVLQNNADLYAYSYGII